MQKEGKIKCHFTPQKVDHTPLTVTDIERALHPHCSIYAILDYILQIKMSQSLFNVVNSCRGKDLPGWIGASLDLNSKTHRGGTG